MSIVMEWNIRYITFTESFSVTIRGLHQRRHPTRRNCCMGAGADDGDDDVGADDGDDSGGDDDQT